MSLHVTYRQGCIKTACVEIISRPETGKKRKKNREFVKSQPTFPYGKLTEQMDH